MKHNVSFSCKLYGLLFLLSAFYIQLQAQVLAPQIEYEVAKGKPTTQSSNYNSVNGLAMKAVDGNTSGKWSDQSVTHTKKESNPYWEVDLKSSYSISRITIWNRTDCCSDRLNNLQVFTRGTTEEDWKPYSTQNYSYKPGDEQYAITFCEVPVEARYVRLQLNNPAGILSLAEVQVFTNDFSNERINPFVTGAKIALKTDIGYWVRVCYDCQELKYSSIDHTATANNTATVKPDEWEIFTVEQQDGKIRLKHKDGKYLGECGGCRKSGNPGSIIVATETLKDGKVRPSALFTTVLLENGKYAIKNATSNKYWSRYRPGGPGQPVVGMKNGINHLIASYRSAPDIAATAFEVHVIEEGKKGSGTVSKTGRNIIDYELSSLPDAERKKGSQLSNIYTYKVKDSQNNNFFDYRTLPVGIRDFGPENGINFKRLASFYMNRGMDCSGPMFQGDKDNWEPACYIHDVMYATLPPAGKENAWKDYADKALAINMCKICQDIWPEGSPGLGGCFDGARNSYNVLKSGWAGIIAKDEAKTAFQNGQRFAKDRCMPRMTEDEYKKITAYIDAHWIPDFGTSWEPGPGIFNFFYKGNYFIGEK